MRRGADGGGREGGALVAVDREARQRRGMAGCWREGELERSSGCESGSIQPMQSGAGRSTRWT